MKTAETAWNADLRSAQRAEGPRTTRRQSSRATEVQEPPLRPFAPRERTIPQVGAVPCAARSRSACRPEVGVPSRRRHFGRWALHGVAPSGSGALRACGPTGRVPTGGRRSKPVRHLRRWALHGVAPSGSGALRACGPTGRVPTGGRHSGPKARGRRAALRPGRQRPGRVPSARLHRGREPSRNSASCRALRGRAARADQRPVAVKVQSGMQKRLGTPTSGRHSGPKARGRRAALRPGRQRPGRVPSARLHRGREPSRNSASCRAPRGRAARCRPEASCCESAVRNAETAWNADLRSAQRAEGPRATRR